VYPSLIEMGGELDMFSTGTVKFEDEFIESSQMIIMSELAKIFNITKAACKCIREVKNTTITSKLLFAILKSQSIEIEDKYLLNLIKDHILNNELHSEYSYWISLLLIRCFYHLLPKDWIPVSILVKE